MHMAGGAARATILLSVAFAAAAIVVVYFTAGTAVERDVVHRQTQMVIRSLLFNMSLPDGAARAIQSAVPAPDKQADAIAATKNSGVRMRAFMCVAALLVGAWFVSKRWAGPAFPLVVRSAALSGALAAGTELAFLLLVARSYDSADPNSVRLQILQQLQQQQSP